MIDAIAIALLAGIAGGCGVVALAVWIMGEWL